MAHLSPFNFSSSIDEFMEKFGRNGTELSFRSERNKIIRLSQEEMDGLLDDFQFRMSWARLIWIFLVVLQLPWLMVSASVEEAFPIVSGNQLSAMLLVFWPCMLAPLVYFSIHDRALSMPIRKFGFREEVLDEGWHGHFERNPVRMFIKVIVGFYIVGGLALTIGDTLLPFESYKRMYRAWMAINAAIFPVMALGLFYGWRWRKKQERR